MPYTEEKYGLTLKWIVCRYRIAICKRAYSEEDLCLPSVSLLPQQITLETSDGFSAWQLSYIRNFLNILPTNS